MAWLADELDAFLGTEASREGILDTCVPGLGIFQRASRDVCTHVLYRPVVCVVVQGAKRVRLGDQTFDCAEGQILAVSFDAAVEATLLRASPRKPFRALSLELDFGILQEVASGHPSLPPSGEGRVDGVFVAEREEGLADAFARLFRLVRTPQAVGVLAPGILREIAYHLLSGPRGRDFLNLASPGSHGRLLVSAVGRIQHDLAAPLRVPEIAASVGMSVSLFHQRFKELTSFTPIQYQKRLRLLEARRLMLVEGAQVGDAAYRVGYRSPSQFSREYVRLFGAPPRREVVASLPARRRTSRVLVT